MPQLLPHAYHLHIQIRVEPRVIRETIKVPRNNKQKQQHHRPRCWIHIENPAFTPFVVPLTDLLPEAHPKALKRTRRRRKSTRSTNTRLLRNEQRSLLRLPQRRVKIPNPPKRDHVALTDQTMTMSEVTGARLEVEPKEVMQVLRRLTKTVHNVGHPHRQCLLRKKVSDNESIE